MSIGFPGDYGGDAAAGAEIAAEANGLDFTSVETGPGPGGAGAARSARSSGRSPTW